MAPIWDPSWGVLIDEGDAAGVELVYYGAAA